LPDPTPIASGRSPAVAAELGVLGGRSVALVRIAGGKHHGAIGIAGSDAAARAIRLATDTGTPIVGILDTSGAEIGEGVSALHGWGRIAAGLASASGVVPIVLVVTGACVSGPSLLLGLADHVVMTTDAFAFVTGPADVEMFTGVAVDRTTLGGATTHARRTGIASLLADDERHALALVSALLEHLPAHHLDDPPRAATADPADRPCRRAAAVVPERSEAPYDVRTVVEDVLDDGVLLELEPDHAPNLVVGYGRLDGRSVGIVANQPAFRAGTLDIDASRKGARFVQTCDAFNVPLLTFVDTPGFEPGTDLEWRGMIRFGSQLAHTYAEATVPRLCVVLRKAYGGAYIVMDSRGLGNDWCAAWPSAEIAVMGARGAVEILHRRRLAAIEDDGARAVEQQALEDDYTLRFATPHEAAARGYVDEVIDPFATRAALAGALDRLAAKREPEVRRRHSNIRL
jgi:acetyl-CoA carboxylase carboxyltransferase component